MKNLTTEIIIDAPAETVWNILMDYEAYPEWNPFIKNLSGSVKPGEYISVTLQLEDKDPMEFKPVVLVNNETKEFRWQGKLFVKGLFDGEHYFLLEQVGANKTRFVHGEKFTGILTGVLLKMIGENTQAGFKAMNQALKVQAENFNLN